jgi:hypothetical protein
MEQDPPKAATVLALDIILNKRSPRDAAIAIEKYRHQAPEDPPLMSLRTFTTLAPALVAAASAEVDAQERVPVPASADDIVKEIATFIEEDEGTPGETQHARLSRAARMLSKFHGRYLLRS